MQGTMQGTCKDKARKNQGTCKDNARGKQR